jgi:hypothetical protein
MEYLRMKNLSLCYSNTHLIVAVKATYFWLSLVIISVLLLSTIYLFLDSRSTVGGFFAEGYIVTKHDVYAVAELFGYLRFLFFTVLLIFVFGLFAHLHEIKHKSIVTS